MSYRDLLAFIDEKRAEREAIRLQIRQVIADRRELLEAATSGKGRGRSKLAETIQQALRSQAAAKGFTREE